jgi:hypothetical protein
MARGRASIFDDFAEAPPIDISGFSPRPAAVPAPPTQEQVKAVSEAANFPSREGAKASAKPKREPRRYRTGRNVQFNAKALQTTIDRFYALCDNTGWVMGYTLERAVEALERELHTEA